MALSSLFFGLNRYSIIDSFRSDYFVIPFLLDIFFCAKTPTANKNKTELQEQSRFASMVPPACNARCLSLSYTA